MKAMVLTELTSLDRDDSPLELVRLPDPVPGAGEVLIRVSACGVCHTELDEIEGRTPPPALPLVLGHEIVGRVEALGEGCSVHEVGERVGVGWIYSSCGSCEYCLAGLENLCPDFKATGRDVDGGYAEYVAVPERTAYAIPESYSDAEAAPLMCAGAIGYRSLTLTGLRNGQNLGLTGFGASGHLVLKMARFQYPESQVFVFARSERQREFAVELGAVWAGDTADHSPERLHAVIDTTPVWKPVVEALKNLRPGGRLVVNAIRKEEVDKQYLLRIDYAGDLWMEREVKSVANVTPRDIREMLELASGIEMKPQVEEYPLEEANRALRELRLGGLRGAKVLRIG
jgi:propanol-preferring alcohol dehydrogenase